MIALRFATHAVTGDPVDRDTRRARLLAARRYAIRSVPRRGILSGHWDGGNIVGAFRSGQGSFSAISDLVVLAPDAATGSGDARS